MTQNPPLFKDLTDAQRGEMIRLSHEGKCIQYYSPVNDTWMYASTPFWDPNTAYRVKPGIKRVELWVVIKLDGQSWTTAHKEDATEAEAAGLKVRHIIEEFEA